MLTISEIKEKDKQSELYLHGIEMKIMTTLGELLYTEHLIHYIIRAEIIYCDMIISIFRD
jgi:hypothetical protein